MYLAPNYYRSNPHDVPAEGKGVECEHFSGTHLPFKKDYGVTRDYGLGVNRVYGLRDINSDTDSHPLQRGEYDSEYEDDSDSEYEEYMWDYEQEYYFESEDQ